MKAQGCHRKEERGAGASGLDGFTLLELLVVVTIMSVMATLAGLGVMLGNRSPDSDAARFVDLFDSARQEAIAEGRVVGLRLSRDQAQKLRREGGEWVPDGDAVAWQGAARVDGDEDAERLIVLWPSDQSDPVQVEFSQDAGRSVRCAVTGVGGASCSG